MVKLINYNALRTLTTPFMIKIYIILVLLGICYAFHYRNQIQGIAIKNNTGNINPKSLKKRLGELKDSLIW